MTTTTTGTADTGAALLDVKGLTKHFTLHGDIYSRLAGEKARTLKAVDGIDFHVAKGETLGLVGESGCGKSTTARLVSRLIEPTAGEIRLKGEDLLAFCGIKLKREKTVKKARRKRWHYHPHAPSVPPSPLDKIVEDIERYVYANPIGPVPGTPKYLEKQHQQYMADLHARYGSPVETFP